MAEKAQLDTGYETGLSVVVPVHNDSDALARLLPQLLQQQAVTEVVVSASTSDDALEANCDRPRVRLITGTPGRGQQLNRGTQAARCRTLWFVHADATVTPHAARIITQRVASGDTGGWFRFRFQGVQSTATDRLASLINWRARHGVAYGDQGLFMSRDAFVEAGGFDDTPLFEESRLVRRLKRTGRFNESHLSIGVDPRRWQGTGWIKRTLINRALALGNIAGIKPATLARWYQRSR
ncbi:MAG: glycosyltransferase [Pseudomonadota bacterium]